jgi:prophage tail gpP-like protein
MGLLIDSFCEPPWKTVTGMKLKALAELLLAKTPFINRKTIVYQENVVGKLKGKNTSASSGFLSGLDTAQKIGQIEAGMTIFEVLKNYSLSRGMLFYCLPDGTLVFGRPLAKGAAEYTLQLLKSGKGNNVIESEVEEDISRCYSKYTVVGQQQGAPTIANPSGINTNNKGTPCLDEEMPFYKPFVACDNNDNVSPAMRAKIIMEKHRREGTHLVYTVGRHSQNGKNWAINKMCHIKDEKQSLNGVKGIDADYLIYGRTFTMTKEEGPRTILKLGLPGVVA